MATVISASTTSNTSYNVLPDTSGSLAFQTGTTPTTALTISASQVTTFANAPVIPGGTINGNLTFGTSNAGIVFDNSSSLINSTLNDYETGTWTPTQGSGLTYTGTLVVAGTYTKIGRVVTVNFRVSATTLTCALAAQFIAGLPFSTAIDAIGFYGASTNGANSVNYVFEAYSTGLIAGGVAVSGSSVYGSITYFATF
jgi:hypothetical protein